MERLTVKRKDGRWALAPLSGVSPIENMTRLPEALDRLAAYEDTGLEPEYIPELLADANAMVKAINAKAALDEADKTVLSKALETYGAEKQTLKVYEEMAELQKELCKNSWGAENLMEIAEEIADVQIMLEQMIILHDCADAVKGFRIAKLIRLAEKLEEAL